MDQTRFSVDSNGSIGCTFFEWSIHWLSDQQTYYSWYKNKPIGLVSNPITETNAHKHLKNHPQGSHATKECIEVITNQSYNKLVSCYPTNYDITGISELFNIPDTYENRCYLKNLALDDLNKRLKYLQDYNFQIFHIYMSNKTSSYLNLPSRTLTRLKSQHLIDFKNAKDLIVDYLNVYFSESLNKISIKEVWDFRELLAISLSSNLSEQFLIEDFKNYKNNLQLSQRHKFIVVEDLWYNGEEIIVDCLDFLNLQVSQSRMKEWKLIYKDWQKIQMKDLTFVNNLDHIVDAIVNNYHFNLARFNLTTIHEAIIQSRLIRDHNLTIKNFELEKFPNNTQDIHNLLEENFHSIL